MEFVVFIVSATYNGTQSNASLVPRHSPRVYNIEKLRIGLGTRPHVHIVQCMPTFTLECVGCLHYFFLCSRLRFTLTITTTVVNVAMPTQGSGCGLPIVVVLQVDAIYVDLEEVSAGRVKPSHRQVDTVHLLHVKCSEAYKHYDYHVVLQHHG